MANLKELRLRINTVKNTRKITSAMSQIASARLRKAQNAAVAARPYGERMQEMVAELVGGIDPAARTKAHPLLQTQDVESVLLIPMTADRGLCGGFNANINRATTHFIKDEKAAGRDVIVMTVGRKAVDYLSVRHVDIFRKFDAPEHHTLLKLSKAIATQAVEMFLAETSTDACPSVQRVVLLYNHFVSVLTQEVTPAQLLPFETPDTDGAPLMEPAYEPGRKEILEHLIPAALESRIQQAMFNSIAAEIAARRVAMDSATDNASEMIADLTLEFNRERQAAITNELMEIIGGAEALKG